MSYLREYLYIDNIEINSILAQINEGLNQKTTRAQKHQEIRELSHSQSANIGGEAKGKVPFLAEGGVNTSAQAGRGTNHGKSDSTEDLVESVYNDYGVEVLENELKSQDLLRTDHEDLRYGDFVTFKQKFIVVDFSVIEALTNQTMIKETMSQGDTESEFQRLQATIQKQEKKSRHNMNEKEKALFEQRKAQLNSMTENIQQGEDIAYNTKSVHAFGELGNAIFNDSVLVRGENYNAYCERKHFRLNKIQLSMLQNNTRSGTILGVLENRTRLIDNPFSGDDISGKDLAKIDSYFLNTILSNFNLLKDNDFMIKPLAIYFS